MGEVYRARDTRLDRDVAIKISTVEFSDRFSREARSIAALNHSNVCQLYDVGPNYLVLEYVEGENPLGPMSFDEALPIIRQLIDGIEAAHDKNIIHRDLKTANIKITPEGTVKILDFGLAKATESESVGDVANSPTYTMNATQAGVILGTAAYMPPEQAKGKAADRRSDIWSFGVVVYELLTGRTPFEGETAVEILGGVMSKEPDFSRVPLRARRLLRWCLEKDRRKRLAAIGDARVLLEEDSTIVQPPASLPTWKRVLWPATAAVLLLVAAASAYTAWSATRPIERPLIRLSVDLGPEAIRGPRITAILSPDGTRMVFTGRGKSASRQLFMRRLDLPEATPLSGTDIPGAPGLQFPFFSPDGEWIGFIAANRVMKVATQGGSAVMVAEFPDGVGGFSWGDDGNIIIGSLKGLWRVASSGGTAALIKENAGAQAFPDVLPGSRAVLFNTPSTTGGSGFNDMVIAAMVFETGETKILIPGGYWPRFIKTADNTGHLLYVHENTLFGVGFDPDRLEIRGTPVPLLGDVAAGTSTEAGGGQFAFSDTGTFVYLSGRPTAVTYPVQWLTAAGVTTPLIAQPGQFDSPRFSSDGKRLAYSAVGSGTNVGRTNRDVWVYDLQLDTPTQLTFGGDVGSGIAWARDSKHIVYGDGSALWWTAADGSGQPHRLLDKMINPRPMSFAPDGRLAFSPLPTPPPAIPDIWTIPLDFSDPERPKPGKAEPFLAEAHVETDPAFSPDGKFLAYASSESGGGREEVFVRPFPGPGGRWKVSTEGGKFPAWSGTTRDLLFLGGDDRIMARELHDRGELVHSRGKPRAWSPTLILRTGNARNFDISPDGTRAVVFPRPQEGEAQGSLHATLLLNFFDEVRRRIP